MAQTHVQKLTERVVDLFGPNEEIVGSFLVSTGLPPGAEGVASIFGFFGVASVLGSRKWYTVVLTRRAVVLVKNKWESRPSSIIEEYKDGKSLGSIRGTMEYEMSVGDSNYAVPLRWVDEARRVQRLAQRLEG